VSLPSQLQCRIYDGLVYYGHSLAWRCLASSPAHLLGMQKMPVHMRNLDPTLSEFRQLLKTALLTAKPKHIGLALLCFYSKTGFWLCQISTDLDKSLHTPIVVRNTLVNRLRPRSARGRLQAKPERLCFFVIIVTHPKSYIETTDCRDFGGKPSKWR